MTRSARRNVAVIKSYILAFVSGAQRNEWICCLLCSSFIKLATSMPACPLACHASVGLGACAQYYIAFILCKITNTFTRRTFRCFLVWVWAVSVISIRIHRNRIIKTQNTHSGWTTNNAIHLKGHTLTHRRHWMTVPDCTHSHVGSSIRSAYI